MTQGKYFEYPEVLFACKISKECIIGAGFVIVPLPALPTNVFCLPTRIMSCRGSDISVIITVYILVSRL